MDTNIGKISEVHQLLCSYNSWILTKSGSLIAALEIDGKDPDGLNAVDFSGIAVACQGSVFQKLPAKSVVSQYYIHTESGEVMFKHRGDPIIDRLNANRADFLNAGTLAVSRIVMFIEIPPEEAVAKLGAFEQLKHVFLSPFREDSRQALKAHFSSVETIRIIRSQMEELGENLADVAEEICAKWEGLLKPRILTLDEAYAYCKFIANLDPHYIHDSCSVVAPESRYDASLSDGDAKPVSLNNIDCIRLSSDETTYASIYAVNNFGSKTVAPGMWAAGEKSPVGMHGNYMLMIRFKKNTSFQTAMMFNKKKGELDRQQFSLSSVMENKANMNDLEKRQLMKASIREALEDLDEAEALEDHWGHAHAFAVVWGRDAQELKASRKKVKVAMEQSGFQGCWESVGLPRAFKTIQPAGFNFSLRNVEFNTAQIAAASLFYRSSEGQRTIPDLDGEEALYVFQSEDGSPFYFSPWVGGRNLVIGVGPIRSGKSFTKNTLASHFGKYDGYLQGIDVDIGMEPVARLYGDDGGIFKTSDTEVKGFNPFVSCQGPEDMSFFNHLKTQIMSMLETNETPEMRSLKSAEQSSLDEAIRSTMKMPKHLQRLSTVYAHCSESLKEKLSRWVYLESKPGVYADFFDAKEDSIGSIDKKVMAYNLMGVKDNPTVLPIVMQEIFYRVSRIFLSEGTRTVPKYLDIDECATLFMCSPEAVKRIVATIRTMGKYFGGVGLWTQNVQDYSDLESWEAIRSAASTYFFMADPEMNPDSYKEAFKLTDGECEVIRGLTPKKEAFIVQRDLGIAKKVSLEVDMEQYLVSTSKPSETALRERLISDLGYQAGMDEAVRILMEGKNEKAA